MYYKEREGTAEDMGEKPQEGNVMVGMGKGIKNKGMAISP